MTNSKLTCYDVVVVGGGAAGLNAALLLARARRSVLVVDSGEPRNGPAAHVHGFLSRDGVAPAELLAEGRREVAGYGGEIVAAEVLAAERDGEGFRVELDDGSRIRARRVLLATGVVDELPDVPGLRQRWGNDVLHCPYCHGWEVRDEPIAVLATGPMSLHQALLLRQWTDRVVLLLDGMPRPAGADAAKLAARGVEVLAQPVEGLDVADDRLRGVRLSGGRLVEATAVAVAPRSVARPEPAAALGLELVEHPSGAGAHIPSEAGGRTSVPGVWVAGNATDLKATVVVAAAAGAEAGAQINADLVAEETERAVREPFSPAAENRTCEIAAGDARHGLGGAVDAERWDGFYREREQVFSGDVNGALVDEVAGMVPGQVLDLGCGEGADALWLARQGWQVTALDVAQVALERGRKAVAEQAPELAERIAWVRADLAECAPPEGAFDLVSAQYLPLRRERGEAQLRAVLAAVAAGGVLLFVGHDTRDMPEGHGFNTGDYYLADDVRELLDEDWKIEVDEVRARPRAPEGAPHVRDVVLRARRIG
ncbi:FAD-dependent oxidoreductase [Saccharopolyspora griseoalba]|uniref:FAD-dependent oxidoreductase n=1 Tax=Saccharopolyspora griseoalba TaxID=1431848 RepID=A0ABW2LDK8_9PSEU